MWSTTRVHSRPTLFLIYINDLGLASVILTPIMFTDDTNLFSPHNSATNLFKKPTSKLRRISHWSKLNTFLSNESKIRFDLFHRARDTDNLPLQLLILKIR